ncbi:Nif3-like dinuclear metal center hexameric protein [Gemella sp. GH3]|uniref:Nif3-like dinuclear metal center hexameric protein n=1 Tax=unclassified Gemella TaxID=2624949 RepID=UPI0015D09CE0|nr:MULTISPECIES: Nif3-like dinuclear metal center hexameric protein [unclassified Gemella]MBF0713217.1 Nif3-like dinuclear metal center hexameric protein [Gemella sp. GH3.1]NYS50169.1 Nif3-like dinuclear metal center hexameric protein [Gemella sp. GH3]
MVKLKNIYEEIVKLADENLAEKWDNVGIMLGDNEKSVKKILISLDVTTSVVTEAIEKKVDLIISHHPLIFSPLSKINYNDFKGRIIRDLIKNDIAVISAHTNLDSAKEGLNNYMAKLLNLQNTSVLVKNPENSDVGLGRVGNLPNMMSLDNFITYVKEKLNLDFVKLVKANDNNINTVAILGGSGGSFIYGLPNVDIYLTGDIKYHEAIDAKEMQQNLLDIGHFAEKASKNLLKSYLENIDLSKEYDVLLSEVEYEPFEIK